MRSVCQTSASLFSSRMTQPLCGTGLATPAGTEDRIQAADVVVAVFIMMMSFNIFWMVLYFNPL